MAEFVPAPVSPGNVVSDYYLGKTHVIICDDAFRNRSIEEQRQSLRNVSQIASGALRNKLTGEAMKKETERA